MQTKYNDRESKEGLPAQTTWPRYGDVIEDAKKALTDFFALQKNSEAASLIRKDVLIKLGYALELNHEYMRSFIYNKTIDAHLDCDFFVSNSMTPDKDMLPDIVEVFRKDGQIFCHIKDREPILDHDFDNLFLHDNLASPLSTAQKNSLIRRMMQNSCTQKWNLATLIPPELPSVGYTQNENSGRMHSNSNDAQELWAVGMLYISILCDFRLAQANFDKALDIDKNFLPALYAGAGSVHDSSNKNIKLAAERGYVPARFMTLVTNNIHNLSFPNHKLESLSDEMRREYWDSILQSKYASGLCRAATELRYDAQKYWKTDIRKSVYYDKKALQYLQEAAAQNYPRAQIDLAKLHLTGQNAADGTNLIKQNIPQSIATFTALHEDGNVDATIELVKCHENGVGMVQDPHQALWLLKSITEFNPNAHLSHKIKEYDEHILAMKNGFIASYGANLAEATKQSPDVLQELVTAILDKVYITKDEWPALDKRLKTLPDIITKLSTGGSIGEEKQGPSIDIAKIAAHIAEYPLRSTMNFQFKAKPKFEQTKELIEEIDEAIPKLGKNLCGIVAGFLGAKGEDVWRERIERQRLSQNQGESK